MSGELPTETVIRETKEETGLDVTVERLVGVYVKTYKDEFVFTFTCRVVGGQLSITDESDRCRYFEIENLPSNALAKQVEKSWMEDALSSSAQPIFRRIVQSVGEMLQKSQKAKEGTA